MKIYNNNRGLKLFTGARGSGKTTRAIERLKEYPTAYLIVPYESMKKEFYHAVEDQRRILSVFEFLSFANKHRVKKVILDECFSCTDIKLADLYYTLGLYDIEVIGFGTPRGEDKPRECKQVDSGALLHPRFFEELSKFDTAILKRYKDKDGFVVFNNGDLNTNVASISIGDFDGHSRILHNTNNVTY